MALAPDVPPQRPGKTSLKLTARGSASATEVDGTRRTHSHTARAFDDAIGPMDAAAFRRRFFTHNKANPPHSCGGWSASSGPSGLLKASPKGEGFHPSPSGTLNMGGVTPRASSVL
jgi:hypothetical protein